MVPVGSQWQYYKVSSEVSPGSAKTCRAVGRAAKLTGLFACSWCSFSKGPQWQSHSQARAINDRAEHHIKHCILKKKTPSTLEDSQNARNKRLVACNKKTPNNTKIYFNLSAYQSSMSNKISKSYRKVGLAAKCLKLIWIFVPFSGNKSDKKSTTKVGTSLLF